MNRPEHIFMRPQVSANFKRRQCIYVRQGVRCERLAMSHNKAVCCEFCSIAYMRLKPAEKAAMRSMAKESETPVTPQADLKWRSFPCDKCGEIFRTRDPKRKNCSDCWRDRVTAKFLYRVACLECGSVVESCFSRTKYCSKKCLGRAHERTRVRIRRKTPAMQAAARGAE